MVPGAEPGTVQPDAAVPGQMAGEAKRDSETAVAVSVPRENLLTPEALRRMMHTNSETRLL